MAEIPLLCTDGLGVNNSVGRCARAPGHTTGVDFTLDSGWDFGQAAHRAAAIRLLQKGKPYFLVLPVPSEPWMFFSSMTTSRDLRRQRLHAP